MQKKGFLGVKKGFLGAFRYILKIQKNPKGAKKGILGAKKYVFCVLSILDAKQNDSFVDLNRAAKNLKGVIKKLFGLSLRLRARMIQKV